MPLIDDQVKSFVTDKNIRIIPEILIAKCDWDPKWDNSRVTKYTASLFKDDEIPLRAPIDKITRVCAERSVFNFPGNCDAQGQYELNQVYDYTATISFGFPLKNLYLVGEKAHKMFSIMDHEYFIRQRIYYAQKNIQYAVDYYNNLYNIMFQCGYANKMRHTRNAKDIKAIQYNVFCLFAAYIMNCETHKKITNGFNSGFECCIGQTTFHCTRKNTYHNELDPDMNKMFFCWYVAHKTDNGPNYFNTLYDEARYPYAFSGLGADLLSLYDNVYNGGQKMFPGPLTKRFLATQEKIK